MTLTSCIALGNSTTSYRNFLTYALAEKHLESVFLDDLWQHWSRVSKGLCRKWRGYDLSSCSVRVRSNSCIERVSTALSEPILEVFGAFFSSPEEFSCGLYYLLEIKYPFIFQFIFSI